MNEDKNNRAARAARSDEQVRADLCKTTTANYHIYSFDEHLSIQPLIFSSVCIYFDNAQTNTVAGFFVNIVKCEQNRIIAI